MYDKVYSALELKCMELMGENNVSSREMSYIVNRLLANIYSMHINELAYLTEPNNEEDYDEEEEVPG